MGGGIKESGLQTLDKYPGQNFSAKLRAINRIVEAIAKLQVSNIGPAEWIRIIIH